MASLKPKYAEVYLIYCCPKCHCEWSQTTKEVKCLRGMICSGCDYFIKFTPIKHIKVTPTYGIVKKKRRFVEKVEKPAKPPLTNLQNDAILALVALGFPKRESKEFVESHRLQSIEDYIQAAVRKGTSNDSV